MHRNLGSTHETTVAWRRALGEAADVVCTFIHGQASEPDAAISVMRAWEHSWVTQHFVDTSSDLRGATGKLQAAYLDHLVPRPDGRYVVFFVKTDNVAMNRYLERFFAGTGTPDAVTRSVVELWSRAADAQLQQGMSVPGVSIRGCEPRDELVFMRAVQRRLGMYAAPALSVVPGDLYIPDTRERFARAGLE